MPINRFLSGTPSPENTPNPSNENPVVSDSFDNYESPIETYYANAAIFSPHMPRRFPRQVDELSFNVFDDE